MPTEPNTMYEQAHPLPIPWQDGEWTVTGRAYSGFATALQNRLAPNQPAVVIFGADRALVERLTRLLMVTKNGEDLPFTQDRVVPAALVSPGNMTPALAVPKPIICDVL